MTSGQGCRRQIDVHHRAANVERRDGHGGCIGRFGRPRLFPRQRFAIRTIATLRSEEHEGRKLRPRQPRHPTPFVERSTREAPITFEAMPAQRDGVERLAPHRLYRIPEDRFNLSNLDGHVVLMARTESASHNVMRSILIWDAGR
jgi:hypothetical protein